MAEVNPKTVGQSLYWSYANLVMAWVSRIRGDSPWMLRIRGGSSYNKLHYIIRHKTYYGLLRGTTKIGSFLKDEKRKLSLRDFCSYCGSQDDLTLDHMIPRMKSGPHSADNLVVACRSCNSSKQARDLLEWMAAKQTFPTLTVLSRYLKIAIAHCEKHSLMDVSLEEAINIDRGDRPGLFDDQEMDVPLAGSDQPRFPLPFPLVLIPHQFPNPQDLVVWFSSEEKELCHETRLLRLRFDPDEEEDEEKDGTQTEEVNERTLFDLILPPDAGDAWEPPMDFQ